MYFHSNIKHLRQRKNRTQEEIAINLEIKRTTLSGYENGVSQPSLEALLLFSKFYKLSVDTLIKVDLTTLSERQIQEMEMGNDPFLAGRQLRVLATTVNSENEDNVELVPEKAKAGYTASYADPEYIESLPTFSMPMLRKDRKYRTFQISGDSMLPIPSGSYVTAEYMDDWLAIKDGTACVLLTKSEGIVFKIVENQLRSQKKLHLISLNPLFEPYDLAADEILEVWKFAHYISEEIPEPQVGQAEVAAALLELRRDMSLVKRNLKLDN